MLSGTPRAIAMAPVSPDLHTVVGQLPSNYPLVGAVPQFFQPPLSFQAGTIAGNLRNNSRSGVCASRHMAAEQRRRARINERLDALRGLVPHSAKANTAAFLNEVYMYITALHRELEKAGVNTMDINPSTPEQGKHEIESTEENPNSSKRSKSHHDQKEDDDSDVESRVNSKELVGESQLNDFISTVSAPSLFTPSSICKDISSSMLAGKSAFTPTTPDVSLTVGRSSTCDNPARVSSPISKEIRQVSLSAPKISELKPKQAPPVVSVPMVSPFHPSSVALAAAVVADAAAAAQSWGMAAAVAHAQAQVAAQMHAQAQAVVQAQVQAQVSVLKPSGAATNKRKRKNVVADSTVSSQCGFQGVVRPIALKPQRT